MVVIAALTLLPAAPAAAHHETGYADFHPTTPQELHARLTAPAGTPAPHVDFHPTTPQELHARLTDPKAQPRDREDRDDE
jgi:hypothetical protein